MPIRKKKAGKEVETAGMMRWLLTYADMITLLLAMFILLYAVSKINLEKYKKFTDAAADAFGGRKAAAKAGTASSATGLSGLEENLQSAYNTIKGIIDKEKLQDKVQLDIEERGIRLSFMTDGVFFDIGKAELKPGFEKILSSIAPVLMQITNLIRIEGHTCDMPIDTPEFPSNWELSSRRATNVLRFLLEKGLPGAKMSAAGYAETRPICPNNSDKNRTKNRRVDIIILKTSEGKLEPKSPVQHVEVKPGTWISIMQKAKEAAKKKKAGEKEAAIEPGRVEIKPAAQPRPVIVAPLPAAVKPEPVPAPPVIREEAPVVVPIVPEPAVPAPAAAVQPAREEVPAVPVPSARQEAPAALVPPARQEAPAVPVPPAIQEAPAAIAAAPVAVAPAPVAAAAVKKPAPAKKVVPAYHRATVKSAGTAAKAKARTTAAKPSAQAVKPAKTSTSSAVGSVYYPYKPRKPASGN